MSYLKVYQRKELIVLCLILSVNESLKALITISIPSSNKRIHWHQAASKVLS